MNETTLTQLACETAEVAAKADALDAIGAAHGALPEEPVTFITGNNYMPPLRAYGRAEDFWAASDGCTLEDLPTPWEVYVEVFEEELQKNDVALECPEYDNALYVVDLRRFEYIEDAEGDSLNDEWKVIE